MFRFLFRQTPSDPTGPTPVEGPIPSDEESRWNYLQQARNPAFGPKRYPAKDRDDQALVEAIRPYFRDVEVTSGRQGKMLWITVRGPNGPNPVCSGFDDEWLASHSLYDLIESVTRYTAQQLGAQYVDIPQAPKEPSFLGMTAQELNRRIPGVLGYRARWTFGQWAFGAPCVEVSFLSPDAGRGGYETLRLTRRYFPDVLEGIASVDDLLFDVTCRVRDYQESLAAEQAMKEAFEAAWDRAAAEEADEAAQQAWPGLQEADWVGVEVEVEDVGPQHREAAIRCLRAAARHLSAVQDPQHVTSLHCRAALEILEGTPVTTMRSWP